MHAWVSRMTANDVGIDLVLPRFQSDGPVGRGRWRDLVTQGHAVPHVALQRRRYGLTRILIAPLERSLNVASASA